jgi:L-ascorbate metabolism protein UlaG (beta-lactamase superfamily)
MNAAGDATSVTWLGHATALIALGESVFLTDPVLRDSLFHLKRRAPLDRSLIPPVDAILISHAHHDHLDVASLRKLLPGKPVYAPAAAVRVLRRSRFDGELHEIRAGDVFDIDGSQVHVVPAAHGGGRFRAAKPEDGAVGFVIRRPNWASVYFAGDTELFAGLADLSDIDVALLPIGGWWRTLGPGHLDPAGAAKAAALIKPRAVVPVHWATFHPRGLRRLMHPIWFDARRSLQAAMELEAPDVDLRILEIGASARFEPRAPG